MSSSRNPPHSWHNACNAEVSHAMDPRTPFSNSFCRGGLGTLGPCFRVCAGAAWCCPQGVSALPAHGVGRGKFVFWLVKLGSGKVVACVISTAGLSSRAAAGGRDCSVGRRPGGSHHFLVRFQICCISCICRIALGFCCISCNRLQFIVFSCNSS
jgi:hypothetical protein